MAELLSKFQSEIFDILKLAKRTDEISIKAKLWEVFNALSNSLWTNFFKGKPEEKDFSYENKMLKNSLDRMEEQVIRLKKQLQERETGTSQSEIFGLKSEINRLKDLSSDFQRDLNQKIAIIQSQEQQISILKHEIQSKGRESDRWTNRSSEDFKEKLAKITQERDSLRD